MKHNILISIALIVTVIVARLIPHLPNFAPVAAVAIFAGLYLPRKWGALVPLAAMLASDAIIGFYDWHIMASVYGSYVLTWVLAVWLVRKDKNTITVLTSALSGSLFFFLVTNAAVWAFGTMYPHTLSGLGMSYTMGLPFFRNTLAGDLFYTGVLVGGYEAAVYAKTRLCYTMGI